MPENSPPLNPSVDPSTPAMANRKEGRERNIPVFSVWKNNAILKNIFLVNAPPSLDNVRTQKDDQEGENGETQHEFEETLVVGRHPDCDIRLEHPSISRFHLRIHSKPSSLHLSLTDLSSVHGTWVSGRRIEPNVGTGLKEGDTLKIGASSRVYKLHWIPLSQAYDMEHPFVPPMDFPEPRENEEEEIIKDENSPGLESEDVDVVDSVSRPFDSLLMCGCNELKEGIPLAPSVQHQNSHVLDNEDEILEGLVPLFLGENWEWVGKEDNNLACPQVDDTLPLKLEDEAFVDSVLEGSVTFFLDDNSRLLERKIIPSAAPWSENIEFDMPPNLDRGESRNEIFGKMDRGSGKQNPLQGDIQNSKWSLKDATCSPSTTKGVLVDNIPLLFKHEDEGLLAPVLERSDSLFLNENSELLEDKIIPSAAPLMENLHNTMDEPCSSSTKGVLLENIPLPFVHEDEGLLASVMGCSDSLFLELLADKIISSAAPLTGNLYNTMDAGERGNEPFGKVNQGNGKQNALQQGTLMWNFWDGSCSPVTKGGFVDDKDPNLDKENQYQEQEQEPEPRVMTERKWLERDVLHQKSITKEHEVSRLWSFWSGNMGIESICSSVSDAEAFAESESESLRNDYQSPQPLSCVKKQLGDSLLTPEKNSAHSIWSRRGKQASAPQILTSKTEGMKEKKGQEKAKHDPTTRALFHGLDDQDDEIFTPDKENLTPNTHRSRRKLAALKEIKHFNSGESSLFKKLDSPDTYHNSSMSPVSDKENTSKALQEQKAPQHASLNQAQTVRLKRKKGERVPFQTLLADSPQKSISEICTNDADMRCGNSVSYAKTRSKGNCPEDRIQKWNMVVDTNTLLNKESRKALQLLEGLKGTQLIIPRIVITELDCLKRQSFFRKNSDVSSALEWIQDCMIKTQWWIHVQSSIEEGHSVAPTPPGSPHSQFSSGTVTAVSFAVSQPELLSPTAEDHVLDYALSFRKIDDGLLILLSDDVTLKIKAMAEGLICEEAEEFQKSLVNPFSERFLWADSSPRGQTWSCSDDIILREKFYPSSLKMTPKAMENVKGLKLILLHNSQYFERMAATH